MSGTCTNKITMIELHFMAQKVAHASTHGTCCNNAAHAKQCLKLRFLVHFIQMLSTELYYIPQRNPLQSAAMKRLDVRITDAVMRKLVP